MTDKRKCTHKKKPTKKQENPHKPPQPYKSLLLMRLRTAKKKKTTGYLMEALTRMMRTGRRKNSSDNQYSVTVSVANENGSVM